MTFTTLANQSTYFNEIKKSKFTAIASTAASVEDALQFIEANKQTDATHNSWAYKIGREYRFNDDGEMGGTAGKPILNAIEGNNLNNVVVLVIRYYGGTKLGIGGLVRAYGGTAAECLRIAPKICVKPLTSFKVKANFNLVGTIYKVFEKFNLQKSNEVFNENGVELFSEIETDKLEQFKVSLRDSSCGQAELIIEDVL